MAQVMAQASKVLIDIMDAFHRLTVLNTDSALHDDMISLNALIRKENGTPDGHEDDTVRFFEDKVNEILEKSMNDNYVLGRKDLGGMIHGDKGTLIALASRLDAVDSRLKEASDLKKRLLDAEDRAEGKMPQVLVDAKSYHHKLSGKVLNVDQEELVASTIEKLVSELSEIGYNISVMKGEAHVL